MSTSEARPCLYCGDRQKPKTDEHVLQQAFDATMVLDEDVCGDCNTRVFSPLDTAFVQWVRTFICADHPDVRAHGSLLNTAHLVLQDEGTGHWLSARLHKDGTFAILPQTLLIEPKGRGAFHAGAMHEGLIDTMFNELAHPQNCAFKTVVVADHPVQLAVIRSGKNKYLVRGPTQVSADELVTTLKNGRFTLTDREAPSVREQVKPKLHGQLKLPVHLCERACAKIALNFVCGVRSGDFARRPEFAALRDFATGVVDSENITELITEVRDAGVFARPDCHTIFVGEIGTGPIAVIVLYQRPVAVVSLCGGKNDIIKADDAFVGLFNYKTKTHQVTKLRAEPLQWLEAFGRR